MKRKKPLAEINVVPYIDVMLVLLVIFMITAPLLTQGIHVNLPQTTSRALKPTKDQPIVVSVNERGEYFLNTSAHPQQAIKADDLIKNISTLLEKAKRENKIRAVYVKGDKNASYGKVVGAMALLQRAGADEVGLITTELKN